MLYNMQDFQGPFHRGWFIPRPWVKSTRGRTQRNKVASKNKRTHRGCIKKAKLKSSTDLQESSKLSFRNALMGSQKPVEKLSDSKQSGNKEGAGKKAQGKRENSPRNRLQPAKCVVPLRKGSMHDGKMMTKKTEAAAAPAEKVRLLTNSFDKKESKNKKVTTGIDSLPTALCTGTTYRYRWYDWYTQQQYRYCSACAAAADDTNTGSGSGGNEEDLPKNIIASAACSSVAYLAPGLAHDER